MSFRFRGTRELNPETQTLEGSSMIDGFGLIALNERAEELFLDLLDASDDDNTFSDREKDGRRLIQQSFRKLRYILKLMNISQKNAINEHQAPSSGGFISVKSIDEQDFVLETEVHAESFYREAHRMKKVFQTKLNFSSLRDMEFRGVTLLRNNVIDHQNVIVDVQAWSASDGPRLIAHEAQLNNKKQLSDPGFRTNATEFYAELIEKLKEAIAGQKS
jgi:hypothetical protein